MSFIDIKLLLGFEHGDSIYPSYERCILKEARNLTDFSLCVDDLTNSRVSNRLQLGALGSLYFHSVERGGDDEALTREALATLKSIVSRDKLATETTECWRFIEHIVWRYKYVLDQLDFVVDFFLENISNAPPSANRSFDALMSTISDRDDIKEIITKHYLDCCGTTLKYDVFISHAYFAIRNNKKNIGEIWLIDKMLELQMRNKDDRD